MCGNVKATATTTCAPAVTDTVPAALANIDHIKVASFADPVTECPPGSVGCQPVNFANYGVVKAASTAPLKTVIYGITKPVEPSNPSFPAEFFTANADCTVDGTSCKFIGADFSTNVMTEYDTTLPYIVDTALSIPTNTGVFVKQGTQDPPTFTAPPGYVQYEGGVLGSAPLGAVQSRESLIECAKACSGAGSMCTGFNFRLATRECQLVQGNAMPSYTERNAVSFVKENIPTVATYTAYPAGSDLTHEGALCSNANACNADLTKLVGDGVVSSFSTADLESCSYCPVRSYDKAAGVVTNEVGTFAVTPSTYQEHLLYKTQEGVSSPELVDGFYSIKTWLPDTGSIFGTQQILYSKNDLFHGLFTISGGKIYGTVQSTGESGSYDKAKAAILSVQPVTYVDNGYVFQLFDGGILAWDVLSDATVDITGNTNAGTSYGGGSTPQNTVTQTCPAGKLIDSKCYGAVSVSGVRGTPPLPPPTLSLYFMTLPSASYNIGRPYSSIAVPVFFLNSLRT
jgi:hypothetical protein